MADSVQLANGAPFVVETSEHFKRIAVDKLDTKFNGDVHVFFVLTSKNALRRYAVWPFSVKACLIDETQIASANDTVYSFKLLKETHSLYVGTRSSIVRVSLSSCDKHATELKCLHSGDPYCGEQLAARN